MRKLTRWRNAWPLVIAAAGLMVVLGAQPATSADAIGSAPVVPELTVGGGEVVGSKVVATMTVMARRPLADVQIRLELSDGLERTAGEPMWRGRMAAGEVRVVEIAVKLLKPGRQQVIGRVQLQDAREQRAPAVFTTDRWLDVKPNAQQSRPRP